ncbi:PREDICTED: uncharacterized protein LOC105563050 [Vollenhovia emeryi]|uniref:uncharacterized protein LOC105563050 n=1 Tax=Vollenhovia emeryi TaxID=411798 RepID=UPI0005F420E9|nr:PREDICTED: uncharacterized protein LOC105563050 [Vollenhovia emeryi]
MAFFNAYFEKDLSQYPRVDRAYEGKDYVDFRYQFVKDSNKREMDIKKNKSLQRNSKEILKDTSKNLIEKPYTSKWYKKDLSRFFIMISGGFEISTSPWQKERNVSDTFTINNNQLKDDSNVFYNHVGTCHLN